MNAPARWWHQADDGRIVCDLCPRDCTLAEGQRGLCFVRQNVGGQMVSTTYGRSSGFCLDPIEKKPLSHFYPGTSVLSLGTAGCNLTCKFCQNHDISKSRDMDTLASTAMPESIAAAAVRHGAHSVAFTYNDPVIFAEYAIDTAQACHERGVNTVAVTAGYIHEAPRREFFAHMDAANVDLKGFSERFYKQLTGARLDTVLDTLRYLVHETDVWVEITTLVIPGHNDDDAEVAKQCEWIVRELGPDVPLHFSAFHPDFKMRDIPRTPVATLRRAREIAQQTGIHHVYCGNVHDVDSDTTRCAGCGEALIVRDWYQLLSYRLTPGGKCPSCGDALAGRFAETAGDFGRRRLPIHIG